MSATLELSGWSARHDGDGLRWIARGGHEILRGLAPTVRDADWATVPPSQTRIRRGPSSTLVCSALYVAHDLGVHVDTEYALTPGVITMTMTARVLQSTTAQRIGVSILVPLTVAGARWSGESDAGAARGVFPSAIADGLVATRMRRLEWSAGGESVVVAVDGEAVDVEDQRNWSDASFKAFSPPLSDEAPRHLRTGDVVRSRIVLEVSGRVSVATRSAPVATAPRKLALHPTGREFPPVGCVLDPSAARDAALASLGAAFFRVPVDLTSRAWRASLERAVAAGDRARSAVVIEALVGTDIAVWQSFAGAVIDAGASIRTVLVFDAEDGRGAVTTDAALVDQLRTMLRAAGSSAAVGGGTRANFRELREGGAHLAAFEAITFAITPTVHADDEATVLENLETIALLAESAARLAPDAALDIALTLRQRINPYAARPTSCPDPARVDRRLHSDLGAAWLVAALAELSASRATSLTLFEATGEAGWAANPAGVTSRVLHAVARGGELLKGSRLGDLRWFGLEHDGESTVLVANLSPSPVLVALDQPDVEARLSPLSARILSYRSASSE